jgi:hypothetical protein
VPDVRFGPKRIITGWDYGLISATPLSDRG